MKQILFWIAIFLQLLTTNASAQENWSLRKEEAGIKVYTKTEPGSDYKAFKAEMTVVCRIEDIVEIIKNTERFNNWVVNCKGVKLLKAEGNEQWYYIETELPWPFENRDMVYHFRFMELSSKEVKVTVTGLPDYAEHREGIVRLAKANGSWLLTTTDTNKTSLIYEMHVEPGGLIPAWMANPFIVNVPYSTFKELRKLLLK